MANLTDTSATKALDEEKYINDLYDKGRDTQKQLLQENFTQAAGTLNGEQERVQQQKQTDEDLTDAYVNALKGSKNYAEVQTAYGQGSDPMCDKNMR